MLDLSVEYPFIVFQRNCQPKPVTNAEHAAVYSTAG
jgi:hypothetical protein